MSDVKISRRDVTVRMLDGKPEHMLTARGVVQFALFGFLEERNPKCKEAMSRYCQYISMRGYKGGATNALNRLSKMTLADGKRWVIETFDQYVTNEVDAVKYVLGPLINNVT